MLNNVVRSARVYPTFRTIVKSGEYDLLICSVLETTGYGINTAKMCGPVARNMMGGWMRYQTPVVFVNYYTAFFHEAYKACADTVINTHGYTRYTADAVVRCLTKQEDVM